MRKKIILAAGSIILFSTLLLSGQIHRVDRTRYTPQNNTVTYRDSSGRISGTSTKQGNRTIYRDSSGRISGTATKYGSNVTYRDSSGRISGTATKQGNRIIYRDSSGRIIQHRN